MARVDDEIRIFLDEIECLAGPGRVPSLLHVENTLTAGYAWVLRLEAERRRLEHRLAEVGADAVDETDSGVWTTTSRLALADRELSRLRRALTSLRDRRARLIGSGLTYDRGSASPTAA